MWILIFMLCPVVIGFLRYNDLDSAYRILFYTCCLILFNQFLFYSFKCIPGYKLSPFWNNIFNYYTVLCWLPNFVFFAISWSRVNKLISLAFVFTFICIAFILTEIYYVGLGEIRASLALSLCRILAILVIVFCLNDVLNQKLPKKTKISTMLFFIPFIVGSIYYITIDLFIYYLFSNETASMFRDLYDVFMAFAAITYVCYALSFLLSPRKDSFIDVYTTKTGKSVNKSDIKIINHVIDFLIVNNK